MTDADFKQKLERYLGDFKDGVKPAVPLFFSADGSINREKTLSLPAYWKLTEQEKTELYA